MADERYFLSLGDSTLGVSGKRFISTCHQPIFCSVFIGVGVNGESVICAINWERGNRSLRSSLIAVRSASIKGTVVMEGARAIESSNVESIDSVQGSLFFSGRRGLAVLARADGFIALGTLHVGLGAALAGTRLALLNRLLVVRLGLHRRTGRFLNHDNVVSHDVFIET